MADCYPPRAQSKRSNKSRLESKEPAPSDADDTKNPPSTTDSLIAGMANLWGTDSLTDTSLKLADNGIIPVHKVILENEEEILSLKEDNPHAMIAMMKFFYQKEYFPPRDDSLTPLRFLATVYQVADKYLVPQLKEHSIEKFRYVLKKDWNFNDPDNFDDFLSATALIYESTPQSDRGLRDLVVDKALECLSNFGERKGFQELLHNTMCNLSAEELNATYSSLSSSSPSASSYTFNPTKSGSQTTSSPSTTSATTTTENPASTSSGQSRETIVVGSGSHSPSTSLPGGAIGGIVAGVIVALIIALGALYFFLKRNRSQPNPAVGAYPPGPTYTAPPPDRILAAEGKSASSEIAPSKPIYKTGYTKHAYEADTRQTYEADGNVVTQVHEAGGLNRHELAGR
ncbi:BTB/POZ domain protein [Penicillium manginii]|uniref:BTB/POZ domain protein n=1 Tax=Penicillium manginii TaxID=203109 RepID=UPI002548F7FF|nr:BTB/POZ domain protein [Penicillium manginii]KAJ5755166.1 BTB/POZ domain protein [Penicillium manginii]